MRRAFFALIVAAGVALLLPATPASAQAPAPPAAVCEQLRGVANSADGGDPTEVSNDTPGGNGTPVKQLADGAADACEHSDPTALLCGVAAAAEGLHEQGATVADAIRDNPVESLECAAATGRGTTTTTQPPRSGDDDDDDDTEVGAGVTGNGTLPRTGTGPLALTGGIGFAGAATVIRRLLG